METFQAASGYDRKKNPEKKTYRYMTIDEVRNLKRGDHVSFVDVNGRIRDAKVNGQPKTWKRRSDVHVPLKYGMFDCWHEAYDINHHPIGRIVVEVTK